jgi:5-methyltetrahydropteroyltriglutamate--homocysteine methyltransferase
LITTKTGKLEIRDELERRIEQASIFAPVERLALSPQCGFATSIPGNRLSEDEQWEKLALLVETARRVWGASGPGVGSPSSPERCPSS